MSVAHRHRIAPAPAASRGRAAVPDWVAGPVGLIGSLSATAVVALIGRLWTDTGPGSWYRQLEQPSWNPPDWLFGPVWTVLYVLMAVAAWLVARTPGAPAGHVRTALGLHALQLVLNLGWTGAFFGLRRPGWAVAEIAALLVAVVATAVAFARVQRAAAALLVPYAAWVAYAGALTAAIAARN